VLKSREIEELRTSLLAWYGRQRRDLPWRRTRDPYAIWISEIMLQQTRVAAVIPYYERFLARFPDFAALAEAPEQDVLAHWAGLGYYYRARNLQKAARLMREGGAFPATYAAIRELPGVGDYTAAAIASIAFGLPHAVVDGNVFRVLSRVYDAFTNIASGTGRKHFKWIANEVLDRSRPGEFNQAMMELGATICLPKDPQCLLCPLAPLCGARAQGHQNDLPVKIVARKSVEERRTVFWIEREGAVLLWQRATDSRLMAGFWELPEREHIPNADAGQTLGSFRHTITFHKYRFEVIAAGAPNDLGRCEWVRMVDIATLPVSTIVKKAGKVAARS
jgi:A/G-specific adenine glycosylase